MRMRPWELLTIFTDWAFVLRFWLIFCWFSAPISIWIVISSAFVGYTVAFWSCFVVSKSSILISQTTIFWLYYESPNETFHGLSFFCFEEKKFKGVIHHAPKFFHRFFFYEKVQVFALEHSAALCPNTETEKGWWLLVKKIPKLIVLKNTYR